MRFIRRTSLNFNFNYLTQKYIMKNLLPLSVLVMVFCSFSYAQENTERLSQDKPFRIEAEPSSYIAKGWSVLGTYGLPKTRNFHFGLYSIASTLPSGLNERMFRNASKDDEIRLSVEIAGVCRYKIPYFLNTESNPYIGLFYGWETFNYTRNDGYSFKMSNYFLTPQLGYEIYVYKQRLYLNPSVRIVYEFGKKSDYSNLNDPNDQGPMILDWLWLPSFSVGYRL